MRTVGDVTLPKSWSLRFERSGNNANEWKYDMTVQTIEVTGPPPTSQFPIPTLISSNDVLWELGVARRRVSRVFDDTLWRGRAVARGSARAQRRGGWELTSAGVP